MQVLLVESKFLTIILERTKLFFPERTTLSSCVVLKNAVSLLHNNLLEETNNEINAQKNH